MKLHYRGLSYESHSENIETIETGVTGIFRGQTYQIRRPLVEACSQPHMNLKYRGIAYTVNPTSAIKPQISQKNNGNNPAFG
ncbi:MAG TPA: DUF4278 domain-containing protein [Cyanobacteria bacterium UBA8553]|nr:DUF4278 domain-containing protein [Cyanobacteria bacterium UBA8553]HAJ60338.1 DUF4278 domain-containing protein [Cyanobacteria bacterium UBA8543]